jgi:hypothetical protein
LIATLTLCPFLARKARNEQGIRVAFKKGMRIPVYKERRVLIHFMI